MQFLAGPHRNLIGETIVAYLEPSYVRRSYLSNAYPLIFLAETGAPKEVNRLIAQYAITTHRSQNMEDMKQLLREQYGVFTHREQTYRKLLQTIKQFNVPGCKRGGKEWKTAFLQTCYSRKEMETIVVDYFIGAGLLWDVLRDKARVEIEEAYDIFCALRIPISYGENFWRLEISEDEDYPLEHINRRPQWQDRAREDQLSKTRM